MELKDFISETLKQMIDGIQEAQEYAENNKAFINPNTRIYIQGISTIEHPNTGLYGQMIEFDIAVTAIESDQNKGGVGVFIGGVGLGGQLQKDFMNSSLSRIKFTLPVFLPVQDGFPEKNKPTNISNPWNDVKHL